MSLLVDPVRALIFAAAHAFGGNVGAGVLAVSLGVRLAFMPLTLRFARRAAVQRRILEGLKPELERLKVRYKDQPVTLAERTQAIYRRAGYKPVDGEAVLGGLARWPFVADIYGALRSARNLGSFAWITDLARPNLGLSAIIAAGSGASTFLTARVPGNERAALVSAMIGATISLAVLWHLSSAVALSWAANSAGDLIQSVILVRERRATDRPSSKSK